MHKCNLLIEKLLHLKPEFPTLLKELQASIPKTKQPPPSDLNENFQPQTNEAEDPKKSNQTKTQPKQQTPGIPTIITKSNNSPPKKLDNNDTKDNPKENGTKNPTKKKVTKT